ncbi:mycofactocin biosynthesis glycosyltransferase MftF [Nocardia sp. CWNU-33]|uniref:mycofactocin biosynthesis glycosyltransferase MftF n=1 Tax=Nocardia sp. CWNU-33 TaxID=3392117 RepID=UPI00398E5FBB
MGAIERTTAADALPAPAGTTLRIDNSTRRYNRGRVMLGGAPLRLLRLSDAGARLVERWAAGAPVGTDAAEGALARRLVDAGFAHPVPIVSQGFSVRDVTLVVPVKDNPDGVARTLRATADLADRIVVDDGSSEPIPYATTRHPTARGPAAARNTGWRTATTDLVAFLDSDTIPEPEWLDTVLPLFHDPSVAVVAPRIRSLVHGPVGRYEADRSSLDMGPDAAGVRPNGRVRYVPSAALVVRRDVMRVIGGFDDSLRFGEDVDLVWRILATGRTVRYQPNSIVWHEPRGTVRDWLRQRFDYGTSAAPLAIRHPGNLSCAQLTKLNATACVLAATGHPVQAAAMSSATVIAWARRLHRGGVPLPNAASFSARAYFATIAQLVHAMRRTWWPFALFSHRGRVLFAAIVSACALSDMLGGRGIRWAALRLADDLAYGAGVWAGCLRQRTIAPLLPRLARSQGSPR